MLRIKRPPLWSFHPGEYVFVRIPQLASAEWHPFHISSAPEEGGSFTIHVRSQGNWTRALYRAVSGTDRAMTPTP